MPVLPMFPLGSVLFPAMPLGLRVFEPRFMTMLGHVLAGDRTFGVVLIERGTEVGGGDARFSTGTLAHVTRHQPRNTWVAVACQGDRRFEVVRWLEDDPFPRAEVTWLPDFVWDHRLAPQLAATTRAVRQALARATEFEEVGWDPDVHLADEPVTAAWQLAGVTPLGALDHLHLLRSTTLTELLTRTRLAADAAEGRPAS